jgi:homogentisate 1,2-dioxygenase
MIVVHAGRVTLQSQGCTLELAPSASAVIGRGSPLQVEAQANSL